jgi:hypothetical protein
MCKTTLPYINQRIDQHIDQPNGKQVQPHFFDCVCNYSLPLALLFSRYYGRCFFTSNHCLKQHQEVRRRLPTFQTTLSSRKCTYITYKHSHAVITHLTPCTEGARTAQACNHTCCNHSLDTLLAVLPVLCLLNGVLVCPPASITPPLVNPSL